MAYQAQLRQVASHKRIASLFLLPQCDMSCPFCASETGFSVMTFEQAQELLGALRRRGFDNVVLGGGEPFLWPHGVARLGRRAQELGFLVQVCTNGVSLPAGFDRLPGIDRYILPLEAMDPALHDRLRRRRDGHHGVVLDRLRTLAAAGRAVTVSTVLTRENLDQLPAIAEHLAGLRREGAAIHAWHLYRFLPVGRGGARNATRLAVPRREFVRACAAVKRLEPGFRVYRRDNMLRSSTVEFFWFENGGLRVGNLEPAGISPATDGAG